MSALLFLAGFEGGTQPKEVKKYISNAIKGNKVLQLWVDPDSKARAVALLKKELDAEEIEELGREVKLHDKFILTEPTKPIKSVFVKHNEDEELLCYGMQDKLKYLFSSHRYIGCTVNKVKQLSSVSWEVYFMAGWEAVLQACSQSWEEQKLEVIPYFECFKEDIEEQLMRIPSQDEKKKEGKHDKGTTKDKQQQPEKKSHGSFSKGVWDLQNSALQPLPKQETSSTDESDQEMEVDMASHDEEEQKLEVIPYFECFKEDIEEQLMRIPSQDEKKKEGKHDKGTTKDKQQQPEKKSHGSFSKGVWDLQNSALQPLPKQETSSTDESDQEMEVDMASHDEEASPHTSSVGRKQKKDSLNQSEAGKQIKVSNVVFHHDFVWKFLIMLQFEKTVKVMFPKLEIESDDGEAVIKGEEGSVEIVEKMLQQANLKVTKKLERRLHQDKQIRQELLHECDEFLSRPDIQEELEEYISEERLSVVIEEAEGKFSVMVANDKDSEKMPFPEFVSSQIGLKECLSLPDEKFEDDSKWLKFVSVMKRNYPLPHISVVNKSVFLLWLTCRPGGSDTVAKKITKFIENLDAPVSDDSVVCVG